jgi:hypothetical protein
MASSTPSPLSLRLGVDGLRALETSRAAAA